MKEVKEVMSRAFIWETGDAGQNIFRADPEFSTFTASGLRAGLMDLGQVLYNVRLEKCLLGLLNKAISRVKINTFLGLSRDLLQAGYVAAQDFEVS